MIQLTNTAKKIIINSLLDAIDKANENTQFYVYNCPTCDKELYFTLGDIKPYIKINEDYSTSIIGLSKECPDCGSSTHVTYNNQEAIYDFKE